MNTEHDTAAAEETILAASGADTHPPAAGTDTTPAPGAQEAEGTLLTGAAAQAGEAGQPGQTDPDNPPQGGTDQPPTVTADGVEGMEYAPGELDALNALAGKHALPKEAVTEILQWQAKYANVAQEKLGERVQEEIKQHVQTVSRENAKRVHAEWGQDPQTVAANEAAVARAMRAFADEDFRTLMQQTGLGNHPAMVRVMLKVGKAIGDDRFIAGNGGGGSEKSLAERMFPNV